jgi:hypothetical protein
MAIGMAIGVAIMVPTFFIADLLTEEFGSMFFLGPATGVAVGVSIGVALEERYKKSGQIRPLTPQEEKSRRRLLTIGVAVLVLGAVAGALAFMALL